MRATPHPDLDALLERLVKDARELLAERFVAAWLLGSFASGDADLYSDVDFLIVLEDDVPDALLPRLQAMHREIHALDSRWAAHLDGSYVPRAIVRRFDPGYTKLLYLDRGHRELVRSDHCNRLVIRQIARTHGVTLAGPTPRELIDPIDVDALRAEVARDMRGWAAEIDAEPRALASYQPYAVLAYCRMLRTVRSGEIVSKAAAAHWGKQNLPARWHGLIDRALARRREAAAATPPLADPDEVAETRAFIGAVLAGVP